MGVQGRGLAFMTEIVVECSAESAAAARKAWDNGALFRILENGIQSGLIDKTGASVRGVDSVRIRFVGGEVVVRHD